jgi:hypothetical protein
LRFNAQSAEQNGQNYLERQVLRSATGEDIAEAVAAIYAFAPHIVISVAGPVFSRDPDGVLSSIERGWPHGDSTHPYYVLSPNNFPHASSDIAALISSVLFETLNEVNAHQRFIGINVAGSENGDLYNRYLQRLRGVNRLATEGSENYYDAAYFLAYALYAGAPTKPEVFGTDIVLGIERLMTGVTELSVGTEGILDVFEALGTDTQSRIRLNGTLGPPRFDRSTGVRIDTAAVYCLEKLGGVPPIAVHGQVGYFDRDVDPALLRISKLFNNKPLPCLGELGLPRP